MQDKFNQFVADHNGKPLEVEDSSNLDQCFDLALGWCDQIGAPRETIRHLKASEIWTQPLDISLQYFEFIPNTPNGTPHVGDIAVFNDDPGHVSVASGKGDINTFESFDQNWDTVHFHDGNGHPICRLVTHDYNSIYGWLRLRTTTTEPPSTVITDQTKIDMGTSGVMEVQAARSKLNDQENTITSYQKTFTAIRQLLPQ